MQGKRHHISEYGKFRDIVERFTDASGHWLPSTYHPDNDPRVWGFDPEDEGSLQEWYSFFQDYLFEEMRASRLYEQANRWERKKQEWSKK
jgi:hypothetical protein